MRTHIVEWVGYNSKLKKYEGKEEVIAMDEVAAMLKCKKKIRLRIEDSISFDVESIRLKTEEDDNERA